MRCTAQAQASDRVHPKAVLRLVGGITLGVSAAFALAAISIASLRSPFDENQCHKSWDCLSPSATAYLAIAAGLAVAGAAGLIGSIGLEAQRADEKAHEGPSLLCTEAQLSELPRPPE